MTKSFGVCKPAKDGSDPCDTVWKSTSVSWVHPTIQRTRRKILISTQLRQVRARDGRRRRRRHRRQVHRPLRRPRGARRTPRGPLDMVLIARGSRPRRRDGRPRNPSRAARPCRRRCFCARAPRSYPTKLTVFIHSDHGVVGIQWGFTLGAAAGSLERDKVPGAPTRDSFRRRAPARRRGTSGARSSRRRSRRSC